MASDAPVKLVVIDGPAGAGKSTVARRLAARLGVQLLDTGAIYRGLALLARRRGVAWHDEDNLAELAATLPIRFSTAGSGRQLVWLGDEDVSFEIRTPTMSEGASLVSQYPKVREALLECQRALGAQGCVAEGRDMGTVVFPDAAHKFFLTADLRTRALRRGLELGRDRGGLDEVLEQLEQRDRRDSSRSAAPLRAADDAVVVDTSNMEIDDVVAELLAIIAAGEAADPSPDGGA